MVPALSAWPLCLTTPETEPVPPPPQPASPSAAPTTRRPINFWFIASNRLDNAAAQVAIGRHLRRQQNREKNHHRCHSFPSPPRVRVELVSWAWGWALKIVFEVRSVMLESRQVPWGL